MKLLRKIGAYAAAAVIVLPIGIALLATNLGLIVLQGLAWPLAQLRERCRLYVHALRAGTGSSS